MFNLIHENQGPRYNVPGLKQDYHSIRNLLKNTKNKKERKTLAGWLRQIKETLEVLGEDVGPPKEKRKDDDPPTDSI